MRRSISRLSSPRGRRVCLTTAVVLLAAGSAAVGTMSTFTSSQSKAQTASTGTFVFSLNDPGAGTPFTTAISGMAPGDFSDRLVNVVNGGSISYASIAVVVTASPTSLLDTDATNGLQLTIDDCSVPWTQTSSTASATCSGTPTSDTAQTALSSLKTSGPSYTNKLLALSAGGTDYLRFHYGLPTASTGTSGLTSTISFAFTATQATGGAYH